MTPSNNIPMSKADLEAAFTAGQIELYYQPQCNLLTAEFEGVEALVRWQHPAGLLLPKDFLPAMEAAEMMVPLGEWVLNEVCRQSRIWQEQGLQHIRVAINICNDHFQQAHFVDAVFAALSKNNLHPSTLELELTENMVIQADDASALENIRRLRARGVKIALDDFGTGFSSISHLKRIRVDRIKIDRSYIKHIHTNVDDAEIVKAIIALAAGLKLRSLAEGVETHKQLQVLLRYDCQEAQGYYFSKPLSAKETEAFLRQYRDHPFPFKQA